MASEGRREGGSEIRKMVCINQGEREQHIRQQIQLQSKGTDSLFVFLVGFFVLFLCCRNNLNG